MTKSIYTILTNKQIAKNTYQMSLSGDTVSITAPGQFINIKLEGFFLRRPISVCAAETDRLTNISNIVGQGTEALSKLPPGTELDCLTGLGNGFDVGISASAPVLIGGGVGVPPLYMLAKKLTAQGKSPQFLLGFGAADEVILECELRTVGLAGHIATMVCSLGQKCVVTDLLKNLSYDYFYTCGPLPMLKAVYESTHTSGQFSLEERMGCGFGACMGCSHQTTGGPRRVCAEGPVFTKEEVLFDD